MCVTVTQTITNATIFREIPSYGENCPIAPLAQSEVDSIERGEKLIFFWGSISYKTLLLYRYTNFCFSYGGAGWQQQSFLACTFHNDAD